MMIAALVAALAMAPAASAQSICDQYPELPVCQEDEGDEGDDDGAGPVAGDRGGPSAGEGGGELPFTGYPMTPLLLLLLLLLLTGLAIRAYLAVRDRVQTGDAASPLH